MLGLKKEQLSQTDFYSSQSCKAGYMLNKEKAHWSCALGVLQANQTADGALTGQIDGNTNEHELFPEG